MGQKISAKKLKTPEGVGSPCAYALLLTCFYCTSTQSDFLLLPVLNKPDWAD
jgi:hypothetical protein